MSPMPWDQRLGRHLARALARTPITPNQVTSTVLAGGLASAVLFAQGDATLANWAALLFMFTVFFDHVDGELARLTGRTSRFGHYYDGLAMGVSYIGMFVGAGIGLSDGALGGWTVVLGTAAGVSVFFIFSIRLRMEAVHAKESVIQPSFAGFEAEDTLYLVGPITWAGALLPFIVAAGIGTPIFLLWVLWEWRRAARGARAGGREP